ncbi:alpha,alpha-trehalase TreF [Solimonas terrae]|uniref:alpha,alpha-trehalase TreF n=1 Tax=Solimonas terrae TaxID=1396819 RepID=UPI0019D54BE4
MRTAWLAICLLASIGLAHAEAPPTPSTLWKDLFVRVENARLYPDSKTFADAIPKQTPGSILADFDRERPADDKALADFVAAHFDIPGTPDTTAPAGPTLPLRRHISALWPQLVRPAQESSPGSSALDVDFRHIVPGGRFRELYYWDSYFSLLGVVRDGHADLAKDMVDGFAGLIARYGHIPNGTRTYYLSRSQPPVFYLMVGLLSPRDPAVAYARYLPALQAEYAWWMRGAEGLRRGHAARHVVRMQDGALLNRYWDADDHPRDESYVEDVALAAHSSRPPKILYRELRSAAESGWDFSSRWFADGHDLTTIETTAIVPVDLNSLLYGMERAIADGCRHRREQACAHLYTQRAAQRRAAIQTWMWNTGDHCFYDYQWRKHEPTQRLSAATLFPLFVGVADTRQAAAVAGTVRRSLLMPGGLATTTVATGQQWDRPNGWAPLQWIAVVGLRARQQPDLARDIACRWLATVGRNYEREHKLVEKYNLESGAPAGGGEYPLQDGFGWTNGVTAALLDDYPHCGSSAGGARPPASRTGDANSSTPGAPT